MLNLLAGSQNTDTTLAPLMCSVRPHHERERERERFAAERDSNKIKYNSKNKFLSFRSKKRISFFVHPN